VAVDLAGEVPVEAGDQKWARCFIKPGDAEKVAEMVAQAEKTTAGEIVPIIVRRSSTIGYLPYLLTLMMLVVLFIFEVPQNLMLASWNLHLVLFLMVVICFLLSNVLARSIWVQRLMVPKSDQTFQVEARALLEFYQTGIVNTKARTGILLFLSVMERKAVVLADEAIAQKLPPETWQKICQEMVEGIRSGSVAEGLGQAITHCGKILAQHFPPLAENSNELKDLLIIKE
jgi:putative membrane protein